MDAGTVWTWAQVSNDTGGFRTWFKQNADLLVGLPFGNHRKYESLRVDASPNLADVVEGYVQWVGPNKGFGMLLKQAGERGPFEAFDALYQDMRVPRFGRTARFDFLTMVSKVGIADIEPPHAYLNGATGPRRGAKLLLANNPTAAIRTPLLSQAIVQVGDALALSMQVMEDSLCNWQKSQYAYVPFRG